MPYPETYYAGAYWGPRQESAEACCRATAKLTPSCH
ncbi:Imm52 family immunity protein [Corallococcus macrosporus]